MSDTNMLKDDFQKCDVCGEIVLMHGRGEALELDDATYCPRHAKGRMNDEEWELRWGFAMRLLQEIRNDTTKAVKFSLARGVGDRWVVHDEGQIYQVWGRCDDDEESNYTTYSESSLVRDIGRRCSIGAYVGYVPHVVSAAHAPINAKVPINGEPIRTVNHP